MDTMTTNPTYEGLSQTEYQRLIEEVTNNSEAEYVERRRAQNRIAQRNYRKNLQKRNASKSSDKSSKEKDSSSTTISDTESRRGKKTVDYGNRSAGPKPLPTPISTPPVTDMGIDQLGYTFSPVGTLEPLSTRQTSPGCYTPDMFQRDADLVSSLSVFDDPQLGHSSFLYPTTSAMSVGNTALHKAASNGHDLVVKLLLDGSADVNALNITGSTALHLACRGGFLSVAQALIARVVDVNIKDHLGWTALHEAAEIGHEPLIWLLVNNGIDVDSLNFEGHTALHRAAEGGRVNVVQLLLQQGADVNMRTFTD